MCRTQWSGRNNYPRIVVVALVVCVLMLAGCSSTSPSWEALDTPQSDTIVSIAQDPTQTKLLYAGSDHGVVYLARTDVLTTPIGGAGLPSSAQVNALLPAPHTAGLVYAATTNGFFVTTDASGHWSRRGTGLPAGDALTALAYGTNGTILVGTLQHGVYTSANQGSTWTYAGTGLPSGADIYTLFHDPASQAIFAGLDGGGIYASDDGGQTWTQRIAGLAPNAHVYAFTKTPSKGINPTGPTLYAGTNAGLYASTDGGKMWTRSGVGQGLPSGSVRALAADPSTPGLLYAGMGSTVYRTTDGGRHWAILAPGLSRTVTSVVAAILPDGKPVVFAGAGQLQRFPAVGGATNTLLSNIITWGIAIVLLGVAFYVLRRGHSRLNTSLPNVHRRSEPPDGLPPV